MKRSPAPPEPTGLARELAVFVKRVVPGTREQKYRVMPSFVREAPFSYHNAGQNQVTFGFRFGTFLPDTHRLLEGTGENLGHVQLGSADDLNGRGLPDLVRAAAKYRRKDHSPRRTPAKSVRQSTFQ
jgi:hypothetical protein